VDNVSLLLRKLTLELLSRENCSLVCSDAKVQFQRKFSF